MKAFKVDTLKSELNNKRVFCKCPVCGSDEGRELSMPVPNEISTVGHLFEDIEAKDRIKGRFVFCSKCNELSFVYVEEDNRHCRNCPNLTTYDGWIDKCNRFGITNKQWSIYWFKPCDAIDTVVRPINAKTAQNRRKKGVCCKVCVHYNPDGTCRAVEEKILFRCGDKHHENNALFCREFKRKSNKRLNKRKRK